MIQLTPTLRILVATGPVDFRKGIDGLARVCRSVMREDPFSGYLFCFINKRRTSVRVLQYDGQGFWLATKRLSRGRIRWWPDGRDLSTCTLQAHELQMLLLNLDPSRDPVRLWKKVLSA